MLQSRPRTASITRGRPDRHVDPGMCATCSTTVGGVDHEVGADRGLASGDDVTHPCAVTRRSVLEIRDVDVVERTAPLPSPWRRTAAASHGVHRGVGHAHRDLSSGLSTARAARLVGLQDWVRIPFFAAPGNDGRWMSSSVRPRTGRRFSRRDGRDVPKERVLLDHSTADSLSFHCVARDAVQQAVVGDTWSRT